MMVNAREIAPLIAAAAAFAVVLFSSRSRRAQPAPSPFHFFGKQLSGKFTVPSGIVTVTLDTLQWVAENVPEIGILTTKSIGPAPRTGNREPVYAQLSQNTYVNAVGLANPGAEHFAQELRTLKLPADKFLLISIFGSTSADFCAVAATLAPYADGFELNFSCPHAEGYGQEIGQTPHLAVDVLTSLKRITNKPILPKLSPNLTPEATEKLVRALVEAGADGFSCINTVGPIENIDPIAGVNILTKGKGGMSGPSALTHAVRVVTLIRGVLGSIGGKAATLPIIGMGGVSTPADVAALEVAGASAIGVGTALTGMSSLEMRDFFASLAQGRESPLRLSPTLMRFQPMTLDSTLLVNSGLGILSFRESLLCPMPGQFVELWLPGFGEKPFAQALEHPFTLAIRDVGTLSKQLLTLKPGDKVYVRGPYGRGFSVPMSDDGETVHVLVGGGTGIAPLLLLAIRLSQACVPKDRLFVYLGGRSHDQIYFEEEFSAVANVRVSTDDGSKAFKGRVTQLLARDIESSPALRDAKRLQYYNCGPELMMRSAYNVQTAPGRQQAEVHVECSIERYMKCGVGICGVCACDGLRTCVDGPILDEKFLSKSTHFGKHHRDKTTTLLDY